MTGSSPLLRSRPVWWCRCQTGQSRSTPNWRPRPKRQVALHLEQITSVFNRFLFTYIKRVCCSFGNTLEQFTGEVRASLYMWPRSQEPLQHTEGISLCASCGGALAGNQRVDQVIISVYPQLTYIETHTAGQRYRHNKTAFHQQGMLFCCQAEVLPPRYKALSTGAPAPLRTPESPSPNCFRSECLTPGDINHHIVGNLPAPPAQKKK